MRIQHQYPFAKTLYIHNVAYIQHHISIQLYAPRQLYRVFTIFLPPLFEIFPGRTGEAGSNEGDALRTRGIFVLCPRQPESRSGGDSKQAYEGNEAENRGG